MRSGEIVLKELIRYAHSVKDFRSFVSLIPSLSPLLREYDFFCEKVTFLICYFGIVVKKGYQSFILPYIRGI